MFRTAFVSGYDKTAVDAFVLRVRSGLAGVPPRNGLSCDEIREERFPAAPFRSGYRKDDVDQWLDEAEHELHERGGL